MLRLLLPGIVGTLQTIGGLSGENGESGQLKQHESDTVILSVGMEAPVDMRNP